MSKHAPRRHSTESRDPETKQKIQVFVMDCPPCKVFGKTFRSRASREKFINQNHSSH